MSAVTLSPLTPEPLSPMATTVTPSDSCDRCCAEEMDPGLDRDRDEDLDLDRGSAVGQGSSRGTTTSKDTKRCQKPPPLHTGADWKVVLHLPEIEKWLRAAADRVTQLSHSVSQDREGRHVDAHLLQLKDICEDISDHVEQIHALLETEFSLKLLSYSVNIIVDIRSVQLLWHQLRVSVLVLKERLLQGLQDSNGNFTRQTDILQAFNQQDTQTRLEDLTEVDDCGALTIRCSQDYFSLDCGITAYELSDYSPSEEVREPTDGNTQEEESNEPKNFESDEENKDKSDLSDQEVETSSLQEESQLVPTMQCNSESSKRHFMRGGHSTEASPTHPSRPKRVALLGTRGVEGEGTGTDPTTGLQARAELSHSSPSLMEPLDRNRFWLELDAVYPQNQLTVDHLPSPSNSTGVSQPALPDRRSSSVDTGSSDSPPCVPDEAEGRLSHARSRGESESPLPSPTAGQTSSDLEASAEESRPSSSEQWVHRHQADQGGVSSPHRQHWFGSEEFLALPAQLRKTEILAMNLESLAKSVPLGSRRCDPSHDALQDVDDWDLTELNQDLNQDWETVESGADFGSSLEESEDPSPLPARQFQLRRQHLPRRFSPSSSSDAALSLDDSLESGPISELHSEEEVGTVDRGVTAPPMDRAGRDALIQKLLQHLQRQEQEPHALRRMESLVQKLDGFISWLQDSLDATENWTQPRQDLESLRVYLTTHLSFKLNVDSHSSLKDSIMDEGRALLSSISSHHSALRDILHMVSAQWEQLQKQIRRQHGWMLRALRCIQSRLFYQFHQSHEAFSVPSANQKPAHTNEGVKVELISGQFEAQRAVLEQMAVRLNSLQYPTPATRRSCAQTRASSLQELESEFQELSDWLMDMDAMVTDSHQLMMSEEQRHHLFKSSLSELQMMETKRTALLSRLDSFRRSGSDLPRDLVTRVQELSQTWDQIKKILSVHTGPAPVRSAGCPSLLSAAPAGVSGRSALSPLTASLLDQLESRIKELKSWLRDTELLIFNSCLRNTMEPTEQLESFKSLCSDIRARRRGVSSVLKLCQKLLQQHQSSPTAERETGPTAELSPEAQQHQEGLQLLSINLERRWEAIVMQALQWQNRLKRELGDDQVPGNFLEPGLVDLHQITSVQNVGTSGILIDDSWEWDETDMTISESKEDMQEPDLTQDLPAQNGPTSEQKSEMNAKVYQVYNVHDVELYKQPLFPQAKSKNKSGKHKMLTKTLSKDSSFSSVESLPDILGGILKRPQENCNAKVRKGFQRELSVNSRRSESESGIDAGDTETVSSGTQDFEGFEGKLDESSKLEIQDNRKEELGKFEVDSERTHEVLERKSFEERCKLMPENSKGRFLEEEIFLDKKSYMQRRKSRKCAGEAVEILINGRGIITPADSDSDLELENTKPFPELNIEQQSALENRSSPVVSHGSSLESLLALGVDLFPMQRSASFDCTNRNMEAENEEIVENDTLNPEKDGPSSSGELSRRTLDLLKRLENIQSPLGGKMTRSVSDMALISISPSRITASPSLGGKISPLSGISFHLSPPSLIHESSTSLTELSSTEDLSAASDDFKKKQAFLDPTSAANANFYCRKHGNRLEELDGASLSMVVNVSSACTDDEDDNSDLLSSSTLTEEELGVRDEMEERFSATSSANEEDFDGPFGLDYMQKELQNWIRTPFSKSEIGLKDELQCGSNIHCNENAERAVLNSSKLNGSKRDKSAEEENRRNATRSYISQFVDDVENGNIDQSCFKGKDADDELLREEASVFTKKGEALRDSYAYANSEEIAQDMSDFFPQSGNGKQGVSKYSSHLVGQLKGELPCHNSSVQSLPSVEDSNSHDALRKNNGRKAITIQEKFKFVSRVTEQAKREVRERDFQNKRRHGSHCCSHHPTGFYSEEAGGAEEDVHSFVMEIIDLTNARMNNEESQRREEAANIRDKVLEHSHRPVQLRKGDFYSYLSLSSHDSDCGEVLQLLEDINNSSPTQGLTSPSPEQFTQSTPQNPSADRDRGENSVPTALHPLSPDIRDEETLFPACTEEVYLGPPLCYSLAAPKRQRKLFPKENPEAFSAREAGDTSSGLRFDSGNMRAERPGYYSVLEARDSSEDSSDGEKEPDLDRGSCQSSHLFSLRAESEE